MSARGEPVLVTKVLTVLANKYRFLPTEIIVGQKWTWRAQATGVALIVNLPRSVQPVFSPDGQKVWVNHERGYFTEQYTALLIDAARAIAENIPRKIQSPAGRRVVFDAIKKR